MSSNLSATVPVWLAQAREAGYQRAVFLELAKREKERSRYRNAGVSSASTAFPLRKLFPGKSISSELETPDLSRYYSVSIGRDPVNRWANRYSNIEPYDRTRVVVDTSDRACLGCGDGKGRYFNGSWVRELHGQKWWIATQAPLRNTAHAFLSVLSQRIGPSSDPTFPQGSLVRTVVQLTLNFENGRIKAYPYFPLAVGETMTIEPEPGIVAQPYIVTLLEQTTIDDANCVQSKLSFVSQGEDPKKSIIFTHMLYVAWPDHGIPKETDQASLLTFLRLVDTVNKTPHVDGGNHPDPPIMVNCSAGVGRTGTFIALSSLLRFHSLLDPSCPTIGSSKLVPTSPSLLGPLLELDPIAQEIDALREQRPEMVQRGEQVALIYQILERAFLDR